MGAQPTKPEREEADEVQPQGTLPRQPQAAMEDAKVEPTQGDAPSKYYKLLGVPLPTPAFIRDAYGFQWLHFGADIMGEARIVEQLKAAYTQIGTMAAVMIIFSTNMLLARTKLDIRRDIGARKQVMNFYTLACLDPRRRVLHQLRTLLRHAETGHERVPGRSLCGAVCG